MESSFFKAFGISKLIIGLSKSLSMLVIIWNHFFCDITVYHMLPWGKLNQLMMAIVNGKSIFCLNFRNEQLIKKTQEEII